MDQTSNDQSLDKKVVGAQEHAHLAQVQGVDVVVVVPVEVGDQNVAEIVLEGEHEPLGAAVVEADGLSEN